MRGMVGWILLGAALLGGVIAWQLLRSSYKLDIATICNGEKEAGITNATDQKKLNDWISGHLDTPEGSIFFNALVQRPMSDRAKQMRDAAKDAKLASCPIADAYDALQVQIDYQRDLTTLCASDGDMPGLKYDDDAVRAQKLAGWFATKAKTERMKAFGGKLVAAGADDRAGLLRTEGNANTIYVCALADILGTPPAVRPKAGAFVELSAPQVNGDLTSGDVVKALEERLSAMEKCYEAGLARDPKLKGKLLMNIQLAPKGKVLKVAEEGFVFDKGVSDCVKGVLGTAKYPNTSGLVSIIRQPIDFQPKVDDQNGLEPHAE